MSNEANPKHSPFLIGAAAFAMLWVVARAWVQSITIDEADTFLFYVWRPWPSHFDPGANNHVLNSMLMRLVYMIFGASAFTLRVPALLGAALYLAAAYALVRLITNRRALQWALFVCLAYSPLVMDYLVAARGYGLASAFLLWMLVIAAQHQARDAEARKEGVTRACMLISVCAALCVSANFSFAIADALTALGLCLWICREQRRDYFKILAAFVLPGLAVAFVLVGSVVYSWPKGQFTWGADSLLQTVTSLISASLFQPNEYLLNPLLVHSFVHFGTFLYPILAVLLLLTAVLVKLGKHPCALAAICGGALIAALICHEALHVLFGILLPLDRTAMWGMLLFLVAAGALAAAPFKSLAGRISGRALTAILVLLAVYNIACLRLTYFKEWVYDADMKNVYNILAYYNHTYGLTKVSVNWRYVSVLNCYRVMSGRETLEEVPGAPGQLNYYPPGYQAYVFFYPADEGFYKREGLKLVYHDKFTEASVAIRPEVLSTERR